MNDFPMYASLFLIGVALALAGLIGLFLPQGYRPGVLLALLAGTGVGIAGLALGSSSLADGGEESWRVFFNSSIAGFATVVAGLTVAVWRARSGDVSPGRT